MEIDQRIWRVQGGWDRALGNASAAQLILAFGAPEAFESGPAVAELQRAYPAAKIVGCSTAGEIAGVRVSQGSLVCTVIHFDSTQVRTAQTNLASPTASESAGASLARELNSDSLTHVLVFCEGLAVNGSALVKGLAGVLPPHVAVTGGLSADGDRFRRTVVYSGETASSGSAVAIGLYGDRLRVGYGSVGGWDMFGPERLVTRSAGNVLYELDGESALALYKRYLGAHAAGLPGSGLRFPLNVRRDGVSEPVVRTILGVNEADQSMTFAGDVPQGSRARLMRANFDRLIEGAASAAKASLPSLQGADAQLALLVSCVGRQLVLQQRCEEEVEGIRSVVGEATCLAGFYSYGEISPFLAGAQCELHNQTMTVTLLAEAA